MTEVLPPVPRTSDQREIERWRIDIKRFLDSIFKSLGLIEWGAVDKTGSNLTDLETRNHADLQNINTTNYYHLTEVNHTDLTDGGATILHKHSHTILDDIGTNTHPQIDTHIADTSIHFDMDTLTTGSALFYDGSTIQEDNANFFWDDSNNRLGLGTNTPASTLDVDGITRLGDSSTNYLEAEADGEVVFHGESRLKWTKIIANSVTLIAGTTPASLVADLQTAHDGNFYHIDEAAGAPGIDFIVDFVSVTAFNWVNIIDCYTGSSSHSVGIQLYNWTATRWDTFNSSQDAQCDVSTANGYILCNHDFIIPDDTDYIGTGGSAGQVRVRFYHTMAGNAAHDFDIDVVALYQ